MLESAQILVVDDTPANLQIITETLAAAGYKISTAINGERALKRLQTYIPDLILLDIMMPGIDGFETCQQIKANPDIAGIPIIFITALSETAQIAKGFALGAVDYVSKPFQEPELLARVKTHLQMQQVNRILEQRVAERTEELESVLSQLQASQVELLQLNDDLQHANQQLEDYSHTLEERVEARTAALKAAQQHILAQEKLASLGTLTAGIAHELRNPLNFVKNYAESSIEISEDLLTILEPVIQSLEPEASDEAQNLMTDLKMNSTTICLYSQRAEQIIDSMMQHTHRDDGEITLQETSLTELIDQAIKLVDHNKRLHWNDFNPSIHTHHDPKVDVITALPSSLMRTFINLIDNACDAMRLKQHQRLNQSKTSERLLGSDYTPTLVISTHQLDGQIEVRIRDNGCGIEPAIRTKILDPFFTTKPPGEGTGLGLFLAYDIISKQHQGTLTLETEPGEFTEFVMTLPQ
ncbi:MAG: response regulator [Cyanobacteria bacterium P01_F01_bin.86]